MIQQNLHVYKKQTLGFNDPKNIILFGFVPT